TDRRRSISSPVRTKEITAMASHFGYIRWGCLLLVAGCQPSAVPSGGQVSQPTLTEAYIHPPSRFSFPPTVAGFARETVKQYDPEGLDISVGYNQGQSIAMTVYVYPKPVDGPDSGLDSHFQNCKREVLSGHRGSELLSGGPASASPGGQKRTGQHAV